MIYREADRESAVKKSLRGGPGEVLMTDLVKTEDLISSGRLFTVCTLEAGSGIGVHEHIGENEVYYITEGEALYNDNGTEVHVEAGDVTVCAPGEVHGILNTGSGILRFVALIVYDNRNEASEESS